MSRTARLPKTLQGYLLWLYPRDHRVEYGEELRVVFGLAVDYAVRRGTFSVLRTGLRELHECLRGALLAGRNAACAGSLPWINPQR